MEAAKNETTANGGRRSGTEALDAREVVKTRHNRAQNWAHRAQYGMPHGTFVPDAQLAAYASGADLHALPPGSELLRRAKHKPNPIGAFREPRLPQALPWRRSNTCLNELRRCDLLPHSAQSVNCLTRLNALGQR